MLWRWQQGSFKTFVLLLSLSVFLPPNAVRAEEAKDDADLRLSVPYGFYNENFGVALAWVEGRIGFPQPQASVLGSAMAGSGGSAMVFLMGKDIRTPFLDRLFIDPILSFGYFDEIDGFIDGNPKFTDERAGTNDSNENNFVTGSGFDNFARIRMKYLLPIGHGRGQIIPDYEVADGFLASGATGGTSLNPFASGRSFIELRPFYRSQEIDGNDVDGKLQTNGIDFTFFWDNRDFPINPSRGNALTIKLSRDFGLLDSTDSWTVLQGELDAYYDFGESDWFRSSVLAFDFWTADTPSWDDDGDNIKHRAPAYMGATLGGVWRMRGYPTQRFNDRSAIYYSAEMRLTPRWNPFDAWPGVQKYLGVEWIQFVPFVEVGRVAGEYDLGELHSDMKWDAGLGLRAWMKGFVVRADTAFSDEGFGVQMMIGHPFQF